MSSNARPRAVDSRDNRACTSECGMVPDGDSKCGTASDHYHGSLSTVEEVDKMKKTLTQKDEMLIFWLLKSMDHEHNFWIRPFSEHGSMNLSRSRR